MIDQCNEAEEQVDNFFKAVADCKMEEVKRMLLINPALAYDVNDRMENVMHIAVSRQSYDMVDLLLEHDSGSKLVRSADIKKRTPLDLAKMTDQRSLVALITSKFKDLKDPVKKEDDKGMKKVQSLAEIREKVDNV